MTLISLTGRTAPSALALRAGAPDRGGGRSAAEPIAAKKEARP
jgi:hypothetical protein